MSDPTSTPNVSVVSWDNNNSPSTAVTSSTPAATGARTSAAQQPLDPMQQFDDYIADIERQLASARLQRDSMKPLSNPPPPPPPPRPPTSSSVPMKDEQPRPHYGLYNSSVNPIRSDSPSGDYSPRRAPSPDSRYKLPATKLPPPSKYDGNTSREGHNKLRSFITEANRYLRLYHVDEKSSDSLAITSMLLTGVASEWLDQIESSSNSTVVKPKCWLDLRAMLRKRFVSPDVAQQAYRKWLSVRYRGNMNDYVHEFMQQFALLPELYHEPGMEMAVVMQFLTGLEYSKDTNFICFTIRDGMKTGKIVNVQDAVDVAINAEANAGGHLASLTHSLISSSSSSSARSGSSFNHRSNSSSNNNWRRSDSSFKHHVPSSSNSYHTPVKPRVHQMVSNDESLVDPFADPFPEQDDGNSHDEDDDDRAPTFHADDGNDGTTRNDPFGGLDNDAVLNVMRFTKKHADVHNLSADELDRRRRHGLCFNCGGNDHRARECKKAKAANGVGAGMGVGTFGGNKSTSSTNHKKNFQ